MMRKSTLFAMAALSLLLSIHPAVGGEKAVISPEEPPLVVVRAADAAGVPRLLETRQMRILKLDDRDYSGTVPGLGVRVPSLRRLLDVLANRRAEELLYCLFGPSLLNQKGAIGALWPDNGSEELGDWLNEYISLDKLHVSEREIPRQRRRWLATVDAGTMTELVGGGKGLRGEEWRRDLESFMTRDPGVLSVWLNPRPLLGAASLVTGIDLRTEAGKAGLKIPSSIELQMTADADANAGFSLRLLNCLQRTPGGDAGEAWQIDTGAPAFFRVTVQRPAELLEAAGAKPGLLAWANLDAAVLSPSAACFELRRNASGALSWSLTCRMENGEALPQQLERLQAWINVFAASPASGIRASVESTPNNGAARRIELGGYAVHFGLVDGKDGGTYLVLADSEASFPASGSIEASKVRKPRLASWTMILDEKPRLDLATALSASLGRQRPFHLDTKDFDALLQPGDEGSLQMDGDSLILTSKRGTAPLIFYGLGLTFEGMVSTLKDNPFRLAAARLRFLLEVCHQSRFREIGPAHVQPAPLPDSLAEIVSGDGLGTNWLDRLFPDFPGHGLAASTIVRSLANGGALDGWRYRIATDGDDWALEAEREDGTVVSADAMGKLFYRDRPGAERKEYVDPLFGIGL